MEKILISACLLGDPVRYDGQSKPIDHELIQQWKKEGRLVPLCPEVSGGLPTPRPPAEISGFDGHGVIAKDGTRVMTEDGFDVTEAFFKGAEVALAMCQQHKIKIAILTANSPSCGSGEIYDGSFLGMKKSGDGVTTASLKKNGVLVFDQFSLARVSRLLNHKN